MDFKKYNLKPCNLFQFLDALASLQFSPISKSDPLVGGSQFQPGSLAHPPAFEACFFPVWKVFDSQVSCKVVIPGCEIFSRLKSSGEVVFARHRVLILFQASFARILNTHSVKPVGLHFAKLL